MTLDLKPCANSRCRSGLPGLIGLEVIGDAGPFAAWLCPGCVVEIRACMETLAQVSNEEGARLEQTQPALIEGQIDG